MADTEKPRRRTLTGRWCLLRWTNLGCGSDASRQARPLPQVHQRSNVYKAHDEGNECKDGDIVTIKEARPMSRTKRWVVIERPQ